MSVTCYSANKIFTGDTWLKDHVIICEDGIITDVLPKKSAANSREVQHVEGMIVPSFIDLQIYGAREKLLAEFPEPSALRALADENAAAGTALCFPTIATNTIQVVHRAIDAIKDYWEAGGHGIGGLHLEGPWINVLKRGAHIESLIHSPKMDEVKSLLDYGEGVIKIITVAPEVVDPEVISHIRDRDIIISAGHSNATFEQAGRSFRNGITAVTHLYNAMSPLGHRSPGLVGATLDDDQVMASIIPDGYHVDFSAIRITKKIMKERLFAITDAVTTTPTGYYQHMPSGDKYEAAGILSGSALTMQKALKNLVQKVNIPLEESLRMCSLYPAIVMKMDKMYGRIGKGYQSMLTVLDDDLGSACLLE